MMTPKQVTVSFTGTQSTSGNFCGQLKFILRRELLAQITSSLLMKNTVVSPGIQSSASFT